MGQSKLFRGCMSPFDLIDIMKQRGMVTQRASDGAQSADVLGMCPTSIVSPAVGVRNECNASG